MTGRTHHDEGSTRIIRYALELNLLWIDGDRRNKVRKALDALDALEAKLASIGAGGVQALSAAPAEQQAAPKAAPGDVLDESLRERDDAEDFIDALLDEVLGHERPEWSSSYGRADALNDVQERMTALHKPAVDKAWGRFQSAMAAPQQEAQEPVVWYEYNADLDAWFLTYHRNPKAKTRPLVFGDTTPQPAPAPLSDDVSQKTWALLDELEKLRGANRDEEDWGTLNKRDSELRAALAAQGGKA